MIEYLGKCLLISEDKEKVLVVGDVHIGYKNNKEMMDAVVNDVLFKEMLAEFDMMFKRLGKVDKIILLGDLTDPFSGLNKENKFDLVNILDYLEKNSNELIVVKGNHDRHIVYATEQRKINIVNYYLWNGYCFVHGDKDFLELHGSDVNCWVMGHIHPAIRLREGITDEKYRCFLEGIFDGKKVIVVPSFAGASEGIDVRELDRELPWNFNLKNFKVRIVGDNLKVLDFGELKKLKS